MENETPKIPFTKQVVPTEQPFNKAAGIPPFVIDPSAILKGIAVGQIKSLIFNADPAVIMSVQFDPDGKTIVSGGGSGTLKVWDAGIPACPIPHLVQT